MIQRTYDYYGICTRVIDGDTIEVELDFGFYIKHTIRVRLLNVNAPELFSGTITERGNGRIAKEHLEGLVLNKYVKMTTLKDRMSFNRYLATVWVDDPLQIPLLEINECMNTFITTNDLNKDNIK